MFPFDYYTAEKRVCVIKKDGIFGEEYEVKLPPKLVLQLWDNDTFSRDDFLGSLTIELHKFPRGARSSKKCSLALLTPEAPTFNLFRVKRTKGWWPFEGLDRINKEYYLSVNLILYFI